MYNTRYLPENFKQCRLIKGIRKAWAQEFNEKNCPDTWQEFDKCLKCTPLGGGVGW